MKKLLLSMLFLPFMAMSQQKGTNTIVIPGITSDQAVKIFQEHGYMIGAATRSVVSTVPQKSKNKITIVFELRIDDSTGYLHGTYDRHAIYKGLWQHAESYAGHDKSGSFEMMDDIAKSFGKPVSYFKK